MLVILLIAVFAFFPFGANGQSIGEQRIFKLERTYDYELKAERQATLVYISPNALFFVSSEQPYRLSDIQNLANEFERTMLPKFSEIFELKNSPTLKEALPIKIVLTKMPSDIAGYFDNDDIRSEIFLNSDNLNDFKKIRVYFAHELQHLFSAYLKDKKFNVKDETWLNELRSEYIPSALGYYDGYPNNLLSQRVKQFLNRPFESFYPWKNTQNNYGMVAMFGHYFIDKFGQISLKDMLLSDKTGLRLLEEIAKKNGLLNGARIYHNFAIANLLNDPKIENGLFSYNNKNLDFKIAPELTVSNINNYEVIINAFDYTVIEIAQSQTNKLLELDSASDFGNDIIYSSLVLMKSSGDVKITTKPQKTKIKNYFYIPEADPNDKIYIVLSSAMEQNAAVKFSFNFIEKSANEFLVSPFDFPVIKENTQPSFTFFGKGFIEPEIVFSNGAKAQIASSSDDKIIFIFPALPQGNYAAQIKNLDGKTISLPQTLFVIEDLPDGAIIQNIKGEKFITQRNLILHIDKRNRVLYNKNDVIPVSEAVFSYYKITNLVKAKNNGKIYEIDKNSYRRWLKMTPEKFILSGRKFEDVFEVSQKELSLYPLGRAIIR